MINRRQFTLSSAAALALPTLNGCATPLINAMDRIGVTTVGLRERFRSTTSRASDADLDLLRWPAFVRETFGVPHVECWSRHFDGESLAYCERLRRAAEDVGTRIINIQLDPFPTQEVDLASEDQTVRLRDIDTVKLWMDRSRACGAPFLRANTDKPTEGRPFNRDLIADSFHRLAEHGESIGVTILVENHGGYSRDIPKVADIVRTVDHRFCRAAADWGNSPGANTAERIASLAPLAELTALVSAKGKVFDETTWSHADYDVAAMTEAFERAGYAGVYSVELYAVPGPSDPVAAIRSMISQVQLGMTRAQP